MFFREINSKPNQWFISNKLIVKESPLHGLGVFATDDIGRFEIIEASPAIIFSRDIMDESLNERQEIYGNAATTNGKRFVLFDYVFNFDKAGKNVCFGLGYVSLYNHSFESSATWKIIRENKEIQIRTKRKIKKGEEITISYLHPSREHELWF